MSVYENEREVTGEIKVRGRVTVEEITDGVEWTEVIWTGFVAEKSEKPGQ